MVAGRLAAAIVPVALMFPVTPRFPLTVVPLRGASDAPARLGVYKSRLNDVPLKVTPVYRSTSCPVELSFTLTRYEIPLGELVAGLGTVSVAVAPLVTVAQNWRLSTWPPPPTMKLMGLSFWSVPRKQSCPAESFCWLRSVMLAAETVVQFCACSCTAKDAKSAKGRILFSMDSPGLA